jgi:protein phosphatase-4 regulatory subunit 3
VESEDEKGRCLLNTTIGKDEGYQKQQGAMISSVSLTHDNGF